MNLYEGMITPPTEPEKMKMMTDQLRQQNNLGLIGQATGDKVMSGMGANLNSSVDNYLNQISATKQKGEQRKVLEKYYNAQADNMKASQLEKNRSNLANEALKGDYNAQLAQLKQQNADNKQQRFLDKDVAKLADQLTKENIPAVVGAINAFDSVVQPYMGSKNIPGVGAIDAGMAMMGLSKDGKQVRSALAEVQNQILKMRSGAAVTENELTRLKTEFGDVMGADDETFMNSWNRFKKTYHGTMQAVKARASQPVYDEFINRYGAPLDISLESTHYSPGEAAVTQDDNSPWNRKWQ